MSEAACAGTSEGSLSGGAVVGWTLLYLLVLSLGVAAVIGTAGNVLVKVSALHGRRLLGSCELWGVSVAMFLIVALDGFDLAPLWWSKSLGFAYALSSTAFEVFVVPFLLGKGHASSSVFKDYSLCVVGLLVLSVVLVTGSGEWITSKEDRESFCWPGQESLCCYHNGTEKRTRGVLTWWEALVMIALYVALHFVSRVLSKMYYKPQVDTESGSMVALRGSSRVDRLAATIVLCAQPNCEKTFAAIVQYNQDQDEFTEDGMIRIAHFYCSSIYAREVGSQLFASINNRKPVDLVAFDKWYTQVQADLVQEANAVFRALVRDIKGLSATLQLLGCRPSASAVTRARRKLGFTKEEPTNQEAFLRWYKACNLESAPPLLLEDKSSLSQRNSFLVRVLLFEKFDNKLCQSLSILVGLLIIVAGCTAITWSLNQLSAMLAVPGTVFGALLPLALDLPLKLFHNGPRVQPSLNLNIALPSAWLFVATISQRPVVLLDSNMPQSCLVLAWFILLFIIGNQVRGWTYDTETILLAGLLMVLWSLQHLLLADWALTVPSLVVCAGCDAGLIVV